MWLDYDPLPQIKIYVANFSNAASAADNVCFTGEVSWLDFATVLAASLRLGAVVGSDRTHPARVRKHRAGQYRPCCRPRRGAELGRTETGRLLPRQQQIADLREPDHVWPRIHDGPERHADIAQGNIHRLAQEKRSSLYSQINSQMSVDIATPIKRTLFTITVLYIRMSVRDTRACQCQC